MMGGTVSFNFLQLKNYYAVERPRISPPLQAIRAQLDAYDAQLTPIAKKMVLSRANETLGVSMK
jgi:hypothetical protein